MNVNDQKDVCAKILHAWINSNKRHFPDPFTCINTFLENSGNHKFFTNDSIIVKRALFHFPIEMKAVQYHSISNNLNANHNSECYYIRNGNFAVSLNKQQRRILCVFFLSRSAFIYIYLISLQSFFIFSFRYRSVEFNSVWNLMFHYGRLANEAIGNHGIL